MNLKPRSILAAVVALSLALPGAALAGGKGRGDHHGGHHGGHGYKHYGHGKHYKHHYGGHYGKHGSKHYYYDNNDYDDALIGLVVGGILGYALSNAQHGSDYSRERYPQTSSAYPATEVYRYSDSSCLQEREYQTTVIVGGREVEAYGTACLQPDGSWRRGPAQLVTY